MPKYSNYMDRALRSKDGRYARLLARLGHVPSGDAPPPMPPKVGAPPTDASREDLRKILSDMDRRFDRRWGVKRLQTEVDKALREMSS